MRERGGRARGDRREEPLNDVLLVVVIVVALGFDFTNGFHDTANAVATSVSTRALTPRLAVLIAAGANVKAATRYNITPLSLACTNGSTAIIERLLQAGVDPNSKSEEGETALMTAARTGMPEALKLLLDRGANVNAVEPEFQQTALMLTVRENHPAAVKILLEHKAELNARTKTGATPAFRPPCKGTGCGSEGVGINRGGLPDRGIRAATPNGGDARSARDRPVRFSRQRPAVRGSRWPSLNRRFATRSGRLRHWRPANGSSPT